jgi:hypothetical protein
MIRMRGQILIVKALVARPDVEHEDIMLSERMAAGQRNWISRRREILSRQDFGFEFGEAGE